VPRVLFIPDRFTDYRMWSDIPDRLEGRAEIIHYDQHEQIPWTEANGGFVAAARRLSRDGSWHVVATAGQAARYGFALAAAGLARGLVFFGPSLDCIPDDVRVDLSGMGEMLRPFQPIVSAVDEPDPGRRREILLGVMNDIAGEYDLEPGHLEVLRGMMSDHADEYFAYLQEIVPEADGHMLPDPPWLQRPWVDRLGELAVPVTVVDRPGPVWETIARRARDAEIAVALGTGFAPADDRIRGADALLRMLDRIR